MLKEWKYAPIIYTMMLQEGSKGAFYQIEHDWNQEAWQEVDGLAVLDAENAEAGADDKHAANDAQLHLHLLRHSVATEITYGIEHPLPAEEDGGCKEHNPAIGSGKDSGSDKVECRIRI